MKSFFRLFAIVVGLSATATAFASSCDRIWVKHDQFDKLKPLIEVEGNPGAYQSEKIGKIFAAHAATHCKEMFQQLPEKTQTPLGFLNHVLETSSWTFGDAVPETLSAAWFNEQMTGKGFLLGLPKATPAAPVADSQKHDKPAAETTTKLVAEKAPVVDRKVEGEISNLKAQVVALKSSVTKLARSATPDVSDAALKAIEVLNARIAKLEAGAAAQGETWAADLAKLQKEMAAVNNVFLEQDLALNEKHFTLSTKVDQVGDEVATLTERMEKENAGLRLDKIEGWMNETQGRLIDIETTVSQNTSKNPLTMGIALVAMVCGVIAYFLNRRERSKTALALSDTNERVGAVEGKVGELEQRQGELRKIQLRHTEALCEQGDAIEAVAAKTSDYKFDVKLVTAEALRQLQEGEGEVVEVKVENLVNGATWMLRVERTGENKFVIHGAVRQPGDKNPLAVGAHRVASVIREAGERECLLNSHLVNLAVKMAA